MNGNKSRMDNTSKTTEELLDIINELHKEKEGMKALYKGSPSENLFKLILENAGEGILGVDMNSNHTYVNSRAASMLGYKTDELLGKNSHSMWHYNKSDGSAFPDAEGPIYTTLKSGKTNKGMGYFWRKDRSGFYVDYSSMPIYENDTIIGAVVTFFDITDSKLAQAEVLKLHAAVESSAEAIFITDLDGLITYINPAFTNLYGFTSDEVIGRVTPRILKSGMMPPDQYKNFWTTILNKEVIIGELINKTKDDRLITVEGSANPILNKHNEIIGFIGIQHDITGRKRTELENQVLYEINKGVTTTSHLDELLKLIHHALKKIVYAENCFVALHDQQTDLFSFPYFIDKYDTAPPLTSMAKSCTAYVFRTLKPFLYNQEAYDLLLEQNEVELVGSASPSWIGIPLQTPSKVIGVLVLQHYEKENVYTENDVKLLLSIGSQIAISIERKKAEEEIKVKNKLLQSLNAEKDKFFSILAHDLRGSLSAFVAATQILSDDIDIMDIKDIREISDSMKTSATNIYSLLENLLEWSRLRQGGMDFMPEKLNIKERVEDCIDLLGEHAKGKGIEIDILIYEEIEIHADAHMIDSVIRNLLSNAIKFTPSGGKVIVESRHINGNFIEVNIIDSGIGMEMELKERLFLINEKTSRYGTEGEPSTGLGLLLCKEFIEKHGGKIWIESEVGKGSTFSFKIPKNN